MNDSEMVTNQGGVWKMDVDTFFPNPAGYVKVKGIEYPIYSFLDVGFADSMRISRLGDEIDRAEQYEDRMVKSIEQIILLNEIAERSGSPRLQREHFDGVSPRQIITLTVFAASIAKVPPVADREESAPGSSPEPSPASADSTGGGAGSSST